MQNGDAFCGFRTADTKNERTIPDIVEFDIESKPIDELHKNQTLHRTRRSFSDFFGVQYRLEKWDKKIIAWR